jgi:hypothetical protein
MRGCWFDILNVPLLAEDGKHETHDSFWEDLGVYFIFSIRTSWKFWLRCQCKVREGMLDYWNNNYKGSEVVKFATWKRKHFSKSVFLHCNIHKQLMTSSEGKTHFLITSWWIGVGVQVYVQSVKRQSMMLISLWWLQKYGRECLYLNEHADDRLLGCWVCELVDSCWCLKGLQGCHFLVKQSKKRGRADVRCEKFWIPEATWFRS